MGSALGFLRWNFDPARIFMGDGGAMLLGFLMATLSLKVRLNGASQAAEWVAPVLVLGFSLSLTRLWYPSPVRRGLLPFATPGKDHTAHRLANWRISTRRAVLGYVCAGLRVWFAGVTGEPARFSADGCRDLRHSACRFSWRYGA